ncbi:hypothetical protein E8E11_003838 [Didymella keratinophila]|nr:hypothetical protein E8E11_003838 [Didymella keratinophila]
MYYDEMTHDLNSRDGLMNAIKQNTHAIKDVSGAGDWINLAMAAAPYFNSYAILNTVAGALHVNENVFCSQPSRASSGAGIDWSAPNGTAVKIAPSQCFTSSSYKNIHSMPNNISSGSRLNSLRFNMPATDDPYELCKGWNITEASLNELLTNITLSALSLDDNKIAAVDSGFLQVMMAVKGNTELETLVVKQGYAGPADISDELKSLQVRYGELPVDEKEDTMGATRKYGFDTVEETQTLRSRRL